MKKGGQKILSLLLALVMMVTMLPAEALAEEVMPEQETSDAVVQTESMEVDVENVEGDALQGSDNGQVESDLLQDAEESQADTDLSNAETDDPTMLGSGFCGGEGNDENLQWTLSTEGVLRIWGTGTMNSCCSDYSSGYSPSAPWYQYRDKIIEVIIEDGVTSIGRSAFTNCYNLESVSMPDSVLKIEDAASDYDAQQSSPASGYPGNAGAFYSCQKLKNIQLSSNLTLIGAEAFCRSGLESITIPHHEAAGLRKARVFKAFQP